MVFLNGSESQFKYVYEIFQNFASTSGCRINWDKSKAFNIGASKHWTQAPLSDMGLQWSNNTVRYLWLIIPTQPSSDPFELFKMNFDGYCNKIESILNLWKSRRLNLIAKINIIKCLILPKHLYKLSVFPTDVYPPFLKILNKIICGLI